MTERRFSCWNWLVLVPVVVALSLLFSAEAQAQGKLDLKKAVKVGSGKIMVIEFTDPDCAYCRKAEEYFAKRKDITRHVFFVPLAMHPMAKAKVQYILSAKDKAAAFREAGSDSFDKKKLAMITQEGIKRQKEHAEIARVHKMNATPTFVIYGRIVEGFDLKKLEPLLK